MPGITYFTVVQVQCPCQKRINVRVAGYKKQGEHGHKRDGVNTRLCSACNRALRVEVYSNASARAFWEKPDLTEHPVTCTVIGQERKEA